MQLNKGVLGSASGNESACQCSRHKRQEFSHWVQKIPWRRKLQPTPVFFREGNGNPLQYSSLESPMDGGAWQAAIHGVVKSKNETEQLHFHFSLSCIGEGNGKPLLCSCLENPRDRGAWQAAVYGVAESDTTEATQQQQ